MNGDRRLHLIAAALLSIGLIASFAACDDDPAPPRASSTPTVPTTSTPATPSPTPPTAPKAEPTPESAEAFVRYFWNVYNYSYASLDTRDLEAISSRNCLFCINTISAIRELSTNNQFISGSKIEVSVAVAPPVNPRPAGLIVATVINETPGRTTDSDGSISNVTNGVRDMKSEIALDWKDGRWSVRDLANDEKTGKPW